MAYSVKILADSVNPSGCRLTTFELTYPRNIHSELLTHRMFSRNSASSRAIPVEKLIKRVEDDPFVPINWGKNQKGMVAGEELAGQERIDAECTWLNLRDHAVIAAKLLLEIGAHKQNVNRLLEPWMWITVIVTATDWDNFYRLRTAADAEPHFQKLAKMMREVQEGSQPKEQRAFEWHLPLVRGEDREFRPEGHNLALLSAARCARVSYLTHAGIRDPLEDYRLHDQLLASGHMSPFEHPAMALAGSERVANFRGWIQYRRLVEVAK